MIDHGFTAAERARVGELYWAAFGRKLRPAFPNPVRGAAYVAGALRPDRVLVARAGGEVLGMCGYHQDGRGAVSPTWRGLRDSFGVRGAARAALALAPLSRRPQPGVLVLDGICVSSPHRGRGIGSELLAAAISHAARRGDREVQLSVVDTNPRAEALYRRLGFRSVEEGEMDLFGDLYGFRRYRTMRKRVTR